VDDGIFGGPALAVRILNEPANMNAVRKEGYGS
jgi:hypothetical protein